MGSLIQGVKSKPSIVLYVAALFGAIGIALLLRSFAATGTQKFEAEGGNVTGTATAKKVGGTSGGSAVTIGNPTVQPEGDIIRSLAYHPMSDVPMSLFEEGKIQALGINIEWHQYQPNAKHVWDEGYKTWTDNFLQNTSARGIKVFAAIMSSPRWANGNQGKNSRNFSNADFCDYIKDIHDRWGDKIEVYSIWNEPGLEGFMQGTDEQRMDRYADLMKASYDCIKALDPNKPVMGGSTYQANAGNADFLRGLYQRGIKGKYDILNAHFYGDTGGHAKWSYGRPESEAPLSYDFLFGQLNQNIIGVLREFGDENKPVWVTETGVNTETNTEAKQAELLGKAYDYLKSGQIPTLKRLYWYQVAEGCGGTGYENTLALLCRNSNGTWRKKPAFDMLSTK